MAPASLPLALSRDGTLGFRHEHERQREISRGIPRPRAGNLSEEEAGALDWLWEPQTSCQPGLEETEGTGTWRGRRRPDFRSPSTAGGEGSGLSLEGKGAPSTSLTQKGQDPIVLLLFLRLYVWGTIQDSQPN